MSSATRASWSATIPARSARLRSIRDEVVDPAIVSHDGRIVKTAGDGLLAEFPSALAALRASVQIQGEMAKRNAGVAAEERIDYRIGINLGDIMIDGHRYRRRWSKCRRTPRSAGRARRDLRVRRSA